MTSAQKRITIGVIITVVIAALTTAGCLAYRQRISNSNSEPVAEEVVEAVCLTKDEVYDEDIEKPIESEEPAVSETAKDVTVASKRNIADYINLQSVVDRWTQSYSYSEAAVEIYDLDHGQIVASYRANASMYPRSIYKLFYTYDAYAQIDAGKDDPNQDFLNGQTLSYCLDIMIRQSDNACAEKMLDDPERAGRVGALVQRLGLATTQSDGLKSSAHDISLLLQHYYNHPDWSAGSWQKFRDTALNQAYTYRKGLPSGFSVATVYDKAGWGNGTGGHYVYNDAAMVEFAPGTSGNTGWRRYIVVAMTSEPASYSILTNLGKMIEQAILYGN